MNTVPPAYQATAPLPQTSRCHTNHVYLRTTSNVGSQRPPSYSAAAPAPTGWLGGQHLPEGIKRQFLASRDLFARRYWIVDNSGSMATSDGHRLVAAPGGRTAFAEASRWDELADTLRFHAETAAALRAPTEFRLLNPATGTPQVVVVGDNAVPADQTRSRQAAAELWRRTDRVDQTPVARAELAAVHALIHSTPTGRTPLCAQIRAVVAEIQRGAPALRASGQRAVMVIASDGAATDGDVARALQPLRDLPVWLVVRLCTDVDAVVQYWNNIDEDLELDMDVLDDFEAEALEVKGPNPFLVYGLPLQRLREWGTQEKIFDLIDEKALAPSELRRLCVLILGPVAADLPPPDLDYNAFQAALKPILARQTEVWDPTRKRNKPWLSVKKLRRRFAGGYFW